MTSGSAARTSSQVSRREGPPGEATASMPPASSIISGTQWPPANGGSSHSSARTRGRGRPAAAARTAASRSSSRPTSASAAAARPTAVADAADVGEDVGEGPRVERQQVRAAGEGLDGAVHLRRRDGADRAELLRDDEVGRELGDPRLVQRVEAGAAPHLGRHRLVHLRGGHPGGQRAAGEDRPPPRLGRVVALVAHPDHQVAGADREEDLRAVRHQRDDAHGGGV